MKMFDPHQAAIEELMKHLDKSDDDDLSSAMKPKDTGVEVMKVGMSQDPDMDGDKDSGAGTSMGDSDAQDDSGQPKLSDEEIQELIEALQQKLG